MSKTEPLILPFPTVLPTDAQCQSMATLTSAINLGVFLDLSWPLTLSIEPSVNSVGHIFRIYLVPYRRHHHSGLNHQKIFPGLLKEPHDWSSCFHLALLETISNTSRGVPTKDGQGHRALLLRIRQWLSISLRVGVESL